MQLGKVVGTVVSTKKDDKLEGLKMLIVKQMDVSGKLSDNFVVAIDSVGAGIGEVVLTAAGSSARLTKQTEGKPVDAIVMAIVDILDIEGEERYKK